MPVVFSGLTIAATNPVIGNLPADVTETADSGTISLTATLTFFADGTISAFSGSWYEPTTTNIGSSYWIRATSGISAGPRRFGTLNTWIALNILPAWSVEQSGGDGSTDWTLTFDFATDSGGTNIVATASTTLTASIGAPL